MVTSSFAMVTSSVTMVTSSVTMVTSSVTMVTSSVTMVTSSITMVTSNESIKTKDVDNIINIVILSHDIARYLYSYIINVFRWHYLVHLNKYYLKYFQCRFTLLMFLNHIYHIIRCPITSYHKTFTVSCNCNFERGPVKHFLLI